MPTENDIRRARLLRLLGPLDERQRYTVVEASAYLRQHPQNTYRQIRAGTLPAIRSGGRVYVSGATIAAVSAAPADTAA